MATELPVLTPASPRDAAHLVEVAFKGSRRGYYTTQDESLARGEHVLVDVERGQDLGQVRSVGGVAVKKCSASGSRAGAVIIRRAEAAEVNKLVILRSDEERVRRESRGMVKQHGLNMKVTDAEWQWDKNKLIIYFTAERRVDFRDLVREMASSFRTRIELRQIGVRDEAAQLGGVGRCGRQLCCATWLREIKPISLQLAKDQNLSLNPAQISGTCGRLMCCLTYEHDAYLQARKRFPREGRVLRTAQGEEKVIGIDIWRETVTLVDLDGERRTVPVAGLRAETAAASPKREGQAKPSAAAPAIIEAAPAVIEAAAPPANDADAAETTAKRRTRGRRRRSRGRSPKPN